MVNNGQKANETTFNTAFVSRTDDSDTVGVVGLNNTTDITSGNQILNTQKAINKLFDADGTAGESDGNAKVYASTNYVVDGDSRKQAIERLDIAALTKLDKLSSSTTDGLAKFSDTTGEVIASTGVTVDGSDNMDIPGNLTVNGDLTVNGTTTTINTATLDVEDVNVTVNKNGNDALAEGAGITVDRTSTQGSLVFDSTLASKWKAGLISLEVELADVSSAQTLTNKSISGDTNTISDLSITSLKTVIGNANKFLSFDATGAPVASISTPDQSTNTTDSPEFVNLLLTGYEELTEITTPSNPPANHYKVYFKNDGKLYKLDSAGNEVEVGGSSGANITLSNLDPTTAINSSLVPDTSDSYDLGAPDLTWSRSYIENDITFYDTTNTLYCGLVGNWSGPSSGSGATVQIAILCNYEAVNKNLAVMTENNGDADALSTGSLYIETGSKSGGTGNTGKVHIQSGNSNGGASGDIDLTSGFAASENSRGSVRVDAKKLQIDSGFLNVWNQSSDPTTPTPSSGDVYYNTTDKIMKIYDGSQWSGLSGTSSGTLIASHVYTASGTYNKNNLASNIKVTVVGGGGGAGGASAAASAASFSGGGGAGGISIKYIDNTSVGSSETITIGSGGSGGNTSGSVGTAGGTSSFGSHCSATGGTGGGAQASGTSSSRGGDPGTGGSGSGGNINLVGGAGVWGGRFSGTAGFPSNGGNNQFGAGGLGSGANTAGANGSGYGAGGGGSSAINGVGNVGGNGTSGIIIIEEY